MVVYRNADSKPAYQQFDEIDDAVRCVEGVRNSDGVEHARIFRMDEVSFEFRPYFKVEIATEPTASTGAAPSIEDFAPMADAFEPPAAPTAPPAPGMEPEPAPVPGFDGPAAEAVPANGRRGLFGR
jgi:hypothetical protein